MIEMLLSVIDRLLNLKQHRNAKLQLVYEQVVEPTFTDLLMVHRDYIQMFEGVLNRLPVETEQGSIEYSSKLSAAAQYLRDRRLDFEPVRVKLGTLALLMQEASFSLDVLIFLGAVSRYFPVGFPRRNHTEASAIIRAIHDVEVDKVKLSDLKRYITFALSTQRQDWSHVCEALAEVKTNLAKRA